MKVAQVLPVVSGNLQTLGIDMQSEIDYSQGLVVGLDINYASATTYYWVILGYNSNRLIAFGGRVYNNQLIDVIFSYADSSSSSVAIGVNLGQLPKKAIFYLVQSGSTLKVATYFKDQGKVSSGQFTVNSTLRLPRYITTSSDLNLMQKCSILIVDTGIKTDNEIMNYFNVLDSINCNSQTTINLINSLIPYADKGQLFGSILNTYTNSQNINFDSDFVSLITSFLTSQGFNVVNYPLSDYKNEVEAIGIYPLNPYSIEESGPDQIKTSSIIVEIQAGSNSRLLEIIEAVRGVVDLLNFSTPIKVSREEVWKTIETDINMAFARLTIEAKTFRRRE